MSLRRVDSLEIRDVDDLQPKKNSLEIRDVPSSLGPGPTSPPSSYPASPSYHSSPPHQKDINSDVEEPISPDERRSSLTSLSSEARSERRCSLGSEASIFSPSEGSGGKFYASGGRTRRNSREKNHARR